MATLPNTAIVRTGRSWSAYCVLWMVPVTATINAAQSNAIATMRSFYRQSKRKANRWVILPTLDARG